MTEAELASLDHDRFLSLFGGVFEGSPWIAEAAWRQAPFHTMKALHAAMVAVLDAAGAEAALALVRAHPDLAGKAALAGDLAAESRAEQAVSGLSSLTAEERALFRHLNAAYRAKFGFPFVMAVRGSDKHTILAAFTERLGNDADAELARALSEIKVIAQLRLDAIAAA